MKNIRQEGYYAVLNDVTYRIDFRANSEQCILWGKGNEFTVLKSRIISAYRLKNWAEIDGFTMWIGNYVNGKYSLAPLNDKKAAEHFGLKYLERDCMYDTVWKGEEDIDSIWEERTPIEGFPFNTEKIVYLKMYGK